MMETQKTRLLTFVSYLGISRNQFEKNIGASTGTIGHLREALSAALLEKIASKYPCLNQIWLLTGNGSMIVPENTYGYTNVNGDNNGSINTGSGTQNITTDSEEVRKLRERVRELELENARMHGMIEILKHK